LFRPCFYRYSSWSPCSRNLIFNVRLRNCSREVIAHHLVDPGLLQLRWMRLCRCGLLVLLAFCFRVGNSVLTVGGVTFHDSSDPNDPIATTSEEKRLQSEDLMLATISDNFGDVVYRCFGWTRDNIKARVRAIPRTLHYGHMFCGGGTLDRECRNKNLWGIGFDRCVHPSMAFLTYQGVALAMLIVLMIKQFGVLGGGPECKSWLWLTRSTTRRSSSNLDGDTTVPMVNLSCLTYFPCFNIVFRICLRPGPKHVDKLPKAVWRWGWVPQG